MSLISSSHSGRILARELFSHACRFGGELAVVVNDYNQLAIIRGGKRLILVQENCIAHVHPDDCTLIDKRLAFHPSDSDIAYSAHRAVRQPRLGWHAIVSAAGVTVFHHRIACEMAEVKLLASLEYYLHADETGGLLVSPRAGTSVRYHQIHICAQPMVEFRRNGSPSTGKAK